MCNARGINPDAVFAFDVAGWPIAAGPARECVKCGAVVCRFSRSREKSGQCSARIRQAMSRCARLRVRQGTFTAVMRSPCVPLSIEREAAHYPVRRKDTAVLSARWATSAARRKAYVSSDHSNAKEAPVPDGECRQRSSETEKRAAPGALCIEEMRAAYAAGPARQRVAVAPVDGSARMCDEKARCSVLLGGEAQAARRCQRSHHRACR